MVNTEAHASRDNDNEEPMGVEYAMPSLLEKFDRRWDTTVYHTSSIKSQDYKIEMSLKEFCDRFYFRWLRGKDDSSSHLHLSERRDRSENAYFPIRLKPHLTEKNANPKSCKHWLYRNYLCIWLIPCKTI